MIALSIALTPMPTLAKAKKPAHKEQTKKVAPKAPKKEDGAKVGDLVVISNEYRSQYGCGGQIVKILKNKKTLYAVTIKECDVLTFTRISLLDRSEFTVIK
jgi:putative ribosome biogenesis GTPase RsgA